VTRELSISLQAAWFASWAAEERALAAAACARILPPAAVVDHLARMRSERERLSSLLAY
jgi:hypothetical protein